MKENAGIMTNSWFYKNIYSIRGEFTFIARSFFWIQPDQMKKNNIAMFFISVSPSYRMNSQNWSKLFTYTKAYKIHNDGFPRIQTFSPDISYHGLRPPHRFPWSNTWWYRKCGEKPHRWWEQWRRLFWWGDCGCCAVCGIFCSQSVRNENTSQLYIWKDIKELASSYWFLPEAQANYQNFQTSKDVQTYYVDIMTYTVVGLVTRKDNHYQISNFIEEQRGKDCRPSKVETHSEIENSLVFWISNEHLK